MSNSEGQFMTLMANLAPRVNNSLKASNKVDCIGLLLYDNETVEVFISIIEDNINEAVTMLQNQLIEIVRKKEPNASCIAYPDYENGKIIALLENSDHYTLEAHIPVLTNPHLHLDLENWTDHDGAIYLFGE